MRDTKFCPVEGFDVVAASTARHAPKNPPEPLIVAPLRAGDVMGARGTTSGKTAFALALAYATAQGRDVFARHTPKDRALFVSFGPGDSFLGYQARALNRRYGAADNLHVLHLPYSGLNSPEAWADVTEAAHDQCPALIVIDSLHPATLSGADRIDGRDPIVSAAWLLSGSAGGAAVFLTHHVGPMRAKSRLHDALDAAEAMSSHEDPPMVRRLTKPGKHWHAEFETRFDVAAFGLDEIDAPITAAVAVEIGAEVTE